MLRLALFVLALAPAWSGTLDLQLLTAERQLRSGMVRQASEGFRRYLEAHPNSGRAKIGLASALSARGKCEEALAILDGIRTRRAWDASAAKAEALCLHRAGDIAGAYAAYEEALWYAPKDAGAWTGLALLAAGWGDADTVERAMDELVVLHRGDILRAVVAAQVAYTQGDPELDVRLAELESFVEGTTGAHLRLLDGLRWLDLDDPMAAEEVLFEAVRRDMDNLQLASWRAEAARRLGDVHEARSALDRALVRRLKETPLGIAIEARLLVDEGELAAAEALIASHPDPGDVEALASAWYIAHVKGERARAAELVAEWRGAVHAHRGQLEYLVPVNQRKQTP